MNRCDRPGPIAGRIAYRAARLAAVALLVAACTPAPAPQGINDPWEEHNRRMHELNRALDGTILRPASLALGRGEPGPVRMAVSSFARNADLPRMVANDVLQGKVEDAVVNTFRFAVNTLFGVAGLFDPASDMGLYARETDFGETMHVWGFREGAYLELPLIGPSTERDAAGRIVDLVFNPLRFVLPARGRTAVTLLDIGSRIGDRARFSATIDSILYESADSYAQLRLLYLQNRRFQLLGDDAFEEFEDPYAE